MCYANDQDRVVTLDKSNVMRLFALDSKGEHQYDYECFQTPLSSAPVGMHHSAGSLVITSQDGAIHSLSIDHQEGQFHQWQKVFQCPYNQLSNAKTNPFNPHHMVLLAKDTPVRIFDLNKAEMAFSCRNVQNDYLDLKVPIFDRDVAFLDPHVFYVSTAYSQIRQYDVRVKKQAVLDYQVTLDKKAPISQILLDHAGTNVIIGNSKGGVYLLDRANLLKNQVNKKVKCGYSSITDMKMHPTQDIMAVSTLDRSVRVFDLEEGTMLRKVFVKQMVTRLLIGGDCDRDNVKDEEEVTQEKKVAVAQRLKKRKTLDLYPV